MKRTAYVLLAACAFVFAGTSFAFANYGPHGSYTTDTDACAECHRAHTATSQVAWTDAQGAPRGEGSALLISNASTMTGFCYACHGDGAVGAATDVQSGVFTGPVDYTNSTANSRLNGGGFATIGGIGANGQPVMSAHNVDGLTGAPLIRWGSNTRTEMSSFTCTDCHDPHGSSNYRLLKDSVNNVTVGGYTASGTPQPYVISNEQNYPQGGWQKGGAGASQVASYTPNYTSPQYAKSNDTNKGMAGWCAACHTQYNQSDSAGVDYAGKIPNSTTSTTYHRHPINVALSVGQGSSIALFTQLVDDDNLPLEMGYGLKATDATYKSTHMWDARGNVSCLTCHYAHGTDATMSGWAATALGGSGVPNVLAGTTQPAQDGVGYTTVGGSVITSGTNPTFDSALLRYDNRGVCERCHNK